MNRTSGLVSSRWALVLLASLALTLGACGRKSGLDLPPSATAAPAGSETSGSETPGQGKNAASMQQNLYNAGNPADRTQYAPKLPKKRIILDPILD